jgi:DNA topoisomerase-3
VTRTIVICEKPSQARNVRDAVGNTYGKIIAARGHILRLALPHEVKPEWKKWSFDMLRPDSGFYPLKPDPSYGKDKLIAEFKSALAGADRVIIATDCDREGQAIGENILRYFKFKGDVFRAMFNAEDPESLRDAFANMEPNKNYLPLYQAAYARTQTDQICNLSLTRAVSLALKPPSMKGSIGIGRVKTPTMGIVCKRETEIADFTAQDYFDLWIDATDGSATARLKFAPKEAERIFDRAVADKLLAQIDGWSGPVEVKKEEKRQSPPKLMDLPTLQSRAARWGWPAKKVLDTAQSLYETHKITTYPRAENKYLPENEIKNAPAMLKALRQLAFIDVTYDTPKIRKGKAGTFSDKQLEGSSHHAIVPNVKTRSKWAELLPKLSADERRLFELIARAYLAAIGPDRIYDRTQITALAAQRPFRAAGTVDRMLGWKEAMGAELDTNETEKGEAASVLPAWNNGQQVKAAHVGIEKKTTKPPPRYTEGSLVGAMQQAWKFAADPATAERLKEAKGIGTVATRDTVIEGLKKQGFFAIEKNQIKATELAMALYDLLLVEAPDIIDPAATAVMELALDEILTGKTNPRDVVDMLVARAETIVVKMRGRGASGKPLDVSVKRKPSPKMIAAARGKAKRDGVKLPRGANADYDTCSAFLGPRTQGSGPSEAQVNFANKIANGAGSGIDPETLADRTKLSAWIDANKGKMPPHNKRNQVSEGSASDQSTSKQIGFAQMLAQGKGVEIPPETLTSRSMLSAWIDSNAPKKGGRKSSNKTQKEK